MVDITRWMKDFETALEETFPGRLEFLGLQGSYARGEAAESSDIDVVVILDTLSPEDIRRYREMLKPLPHRELVCGFLSGRAELYAWEPAELFQFCRDTLPVRGSLEPLLERLGDDAAAAAVRTGACGVYHACVHNLVHERDPEMVKGLLKSAVFTIQAACFRRTGKYLRLQKELLEAAEPQERELITLCQRAKAGELPDLDSASALLFDWAQRLIQEG